MITSMRRLIAIEMEGDKGKCILKGVLTSELVFSFQEGMEIPSGDPRLRHFKILILVSISSPIVRQRRYMMDTDFVSNP